MNFLRSVKTGARVEARGEPWLVIHTEPFDDCALVTLRGAGDDNLGATTTLLAPFDQLMAQPPARRLVRAKRRSTLAHAARAIARAHSWSEAWTAATAQIDLLPWQLEPAQAAVSGTTRLLLTDEVGLGKTVQAGLVISELRARALITRALILTPASLRQQWAAELRDRFRLSAQVFDHSTLSALVTSLPVGVNPWATSDLIVSSIDLVKRTEVRAALDMVPVDILVVDEAHHLKPGTDRAAVIADLAARATWIVLLTATPHSGDESEYAFLRRLGAFDAAEPRVFRRSAADVGRPRSRRMRFQAIVAGAAERELLEATVDYAKAIWSAHGSNRNGALVASVICRRAVSSPGALIRTLRRRRQLLEGVDQISVESQVTLPWLERDDQDEVEGDDLLNGSRLQDPRLEVQRIDRILDLATRVATPAKFLALARLIERAKQPVIVFSEYRDTLTELAALLTSHVTIGVLHGGLSARERRESIERFVDGRADVLLATDAAGEGLNLQARCRLVVNVELPWSPVRLEQRIGRVDRLGQTRRVHALQFFHRDSFEDYVFARLHRRREQAVADLGAQAFGEQELAAAVFDGLLLDGRELLSVARDRDEASPQCDTARRRLSFFLGQRAAASSAYVSLYSSSPGRRSLVRALTLLFESDLHAADGRLIACIVVPIVARLSKGSPHRITVKQVVRAVAGAPQTLATVQSEVAHQVEVTTIELHAAMRAIGGRLVAIENRLADARPRLFQTSLFDRRAEQHARASASARAMLLEHARHRSALVDALGDITATPARLVSAWPSCEE